MLQFQYKIYTLIEKPQDLINQAFEGIIKFFIHQVKFLLINFLLIFSWKDNKLNDFLPLSRFVKLQMRIDQVIINQIFINFFEINTLTQTAS